MPRTTEPGAHTGTGAHAKRLSGRISGGLASQRRRALPIPIGLVAARELGARGGLRPERRAAARARLPDPPRGAREPSVAGRERRARCPRGRRRRAHRLGGAAGGAGRTRCAGRERPRPAHGFGRTGASGYRPRSSRSQQHEPAAGRQRPRPERSAAAGPAAPGGAPGHSPSKPAGARAPQAEEPAGPAARGAAGRGSSAAPRRRGSAARRRRGSAAGLARRLVRGRERIDVPELRSCRDSWQVTAPRGPTSRMGATTSSGDYTPDPWRRPERTRWRRWRRSCPCASAGASSSRPPRSTAASATPTTTGRSASSSSGASRMPGGTAWWSSAPTWSGSTRPSSSTPRCGRPRGTSAASATRWSTARSARRASGPTSSTTRAAPRSPRSGPASASGELTEPRAFNLMFKTNVGAVESSASIAYLRPETAQGIFLNFQERARAPRA